EHSKQLMDVPRLRQLWAVLRALPRGAAGDVMTHGDLIPGNVLVCDGRLVGVIDVGGQDRPILRWILSAPGVGATVPRQLLGLCKRGQIWYPRRDGPRAPTAGSCVLRGGTRSCSSPHSTSGSGRWPQEAASSQGWEGRDATD